MESILQLYMIKSSEHARAGMGARRRAFFQLPVSSPRTNPVSSQNNALSPLPIIMNLSSRFSVVQRLFLSSGLLSGEVSMEIGGFGLFGITWDRAAIRDGKSGP